MVAITWFMLTIVAAVTLLAGGLAWWLSGSLWVAAGVSVVAVIAGLAWIRYS